MADNSSNVSLICSKPDWFWRLEEHLQFVCYQIFMPIHQVVCLAGHPYFLYIVLKQAKNTKGYLYQGYLSMFELLEVVLQLAHFKLLQWSGIAGGKNEWFSRSYFLMFLASHIMVPFYDTILITRLFTAVSMAGDRVFALAKPFVYKDINQLKHQTIAVLVCIGIGLITPFHNGFILRIVPEDEQHYAVAPNYPFLTSIWCPTLGYASCLVRLVGLVTLIGFNIAIVRLYRKKVSKNKVLFKKANQNDRRNHAKEATERTLVRLTATQSLFASILFVFQTAFWLSVYSVPSFALCESFVCIPVLNMVIMTCNVANLMCNIIITPKSRYFLLRFIRPCSAATTFT